MAVTPIYYQTLYNPRTLEVRQVDISQGSAEVLKLYQAGWATGYPSTEPKKITVVPAPPPPTPIAPPPTRTTPSLEEPATTTPIKLDKDIKIEKADAVPAPFAPTPTGRAAAIKHYGSKQAADAALKLQQVSVATGISSPNVLKKYGVYHDGKLTGYNISQYTLDRWWRKQPVEQTVKNLK